MRGGLATFVSAQNLLTTFVAISFSLLSPRSSFFLGTLDKSPRRRSLRMLPTGASGQGGYPAWGVASSAYPMGQHTLAGPGYSVTLPPQQVLVQTPNGPALAQQDPTTGVWMLIPLPAMQPVFPSAVPAPMPILLECYSQNSSFTGPYVHMQALQGQEGYVPSSTYDDRGMHNQRRSAMGSKSARSLRHLATAVDNDVPGISSEVRHSATIGENARPYHGRNVHADLDGKCAFYSFPEGLIASGPYDRFSSVTDKGGLNSGSFFSLFCQMFPIEYVPMASKVLQFVCDRVCGAGVVTRISAMRNKSQTSFTTHFYTEHLWDVVSCLRLRVLMDRHGFWYARNRQEFETMRGYSDRIRNLPQQTRHFLMDGLPCRPLVIEVCRRSKMALLPPRLPHQRSFDEDDVS